MKDVNGGMLKFEPGISYSFTTSAVKLCEKAFKSPAFFGKTERQARKGPAAPRGVWDHSLEKRRKIAAASARVASPRGTSRLPSRPSIRPVATAQLTASAA